MAGPRLHRRALSVVAVVVLLALATGCGGGDDGGAPDPTERPSAPSTTAGPSLPVEDVVARACAAFDGTVLRPVGTAYRVDGEAVPEAVVALAAGGPEPARTHAATLLEIRDGEPPDPGVWLGAAQGLLDWGFEACGVDEVIWGCASSAPKEPASDDEPGAADPEELFAAGGRAGLPVPVRRTADEVVVAWVEDDPLLAVESLRLVAGADGWHDGGGEVCIDPDDPSGSLAPGAADDGVVDTPFGPIEV